MHFQKSLKTKSIIFAGLFFVSSDYSSSSLKVIGEKDPVYSYAINNYFIHEYADGFLITKRLNSNEIVLLDEIPDRGDIKSYSNSFVTIINKQNVTPKYFVYSLDSLQIIDSSYTDCFRAVNDGYIIESEEGTQLVDKKGIQEFENLYFIDEDTINNKLFFYHKRNPDSIDIVSVLKKDNSKKLLATIKGSTVDNKFTNCQYPNIFKYKNKLLLDVYSNKLKTSSIIQFNINTGNIDWVNSFYNNVYQYVIKEDFVLLIMENEVIAIKSTDGKVLWNFNYDFFNEYQVDIIQLDNNIVIPAYDSIFFLDKENGLITKKITNKEQGIYYNMMSRIGKHEILLSTNEGSYIVPNEVLINNDKLNLEH